MGKMDNDILLGYFDSYSEKIYAENNASLTNDKKDKYLNNLINENSVYSNTMLAVIYYEGSMVEQDNAKFLHYLNLASNQGSPFAYASLAVCHYYGFLVNKDFNESNEYLKKYNSTLSRESLDLGAFAFFRKLLKEAGNLSDKDISVLFCDYYIEFFKFCAMRMNDEEFLQGIELNITRYANLAISYGDKNTNFKLFDFYRHFLFDAEKAKPYLKHAALDDKNEDAIELYENLD